MEYKVHVDAGKEDCYWQYVHPGATLYVSAQVLKGGDNKIGVAVKKPNSQIALPYKWQSNAEYEEPSAEAGYWSVCLDNQFSKFSAKLVNLYLTTFRYDEWEKFAEDLQVSQQIYLKSTYYSTDFFEMRCLNSDICETSHFFAICDSNLLTIFFEILEN